MTETLPTAEIVAVLQGGRSFAIRELDENAVDVGMALEVSGTGQPIGRVVGLRQHAQRQEWSVVELDRALPRGCWRGDRVKQWVQP